MEETKGVALRVVSPFMLDGDMVTKGQIIETTEAEAKQFLARGKVVLATEADEKDALRTDGPTVAEYVAAGYRAENYPPEGYESRSTDEEIADAVAAQAAE